MLEVGKLANATEDRSHFAAWAVSSSPLILSFNLSDKTAMDRVWPFVASRAILEINQRWIGHPGTRLTGPPPPPPSKHSKGPPPPPGQVWAKPLGNQSYAVVLFSTVAVEAVVSMPLVNVSSHVAWAKLAGAGTPFAAGGKLCVRDVYASKEMPAGTAVGGGKLAVVLQPHDSAFYCVRAAAADGSCPLKGCPP